MGDTGCLWVVATPIGNLEDMSPRAVDVLRRASHILAEDTRRTRTLLSHFGIPGGLLSRLDAHAQEHDLLRVTEWLRQGEEVALVTDAGTTSVSDPGAAMVRAAVQAGARVVAVPGASAVTVAVAVSGLVDGPFRFFAFLPRTQPERAAELKKVADTPEPCVIFEAPHRMAELVAEMAWLMPKREAVVCRELTKLHEEAIRGTLEEIAAEERTWVGEVTLVLGVWQATEATLPDDDQVDARIDEELAKEGHAKTIAERVSAWSGRPRREVYERVVRRKQER